MRKDLNYEPDRPLMRLESGDEAIISVTHFPERIVRKNDKEKYGGIPNGKYIAKVIRPFYLHCEDYPALSGAYNMWRGDKHGCSDGIYADENKDFNDEDRIT